MTCRLEKEPLRIEPLAALRPLLALMHTVFLLLFLLFLSSCAGVPEPVKPWQPEAPDPMETLPWFSIYPARWYGNRRAACSITFDDGTVDQFLVAAPELDARGIKGTFFIITGPRADGYWQDGPTSRLLFSWDQARELHERGHEIASHTANHADLRAHPHLAEPEIQEALAHTSPRLM